MKSCKKFFTRSRDLLEKAQRSDLGRKVSFLFLRSAQLSLAGNQRCHLALGSGQPTGLGSRRNNLFWLVSQTYVWQTVILHWKGTWTSHVLSLEVDSNGHSSGTQSESSQSPQHPARVYVLPFIGGDLKLRCQCLPGDWFPWGTWSRGHFCLLEVYSWQQIVRTILKLRAVFLSLWVLTLWGSNYRFTGVA